MSEPAQGDIKIGPGEVPATFQDVTKESSSDVKPPESKSEDAKQSKASADTAGQEAAALMLDRILKRSTGEDPDKQDKPKDDGADKKAEDKHEKKQEAKKPDDATEDKKEEVRPRRKRTLNPDKIAEIAGKAAAEAVRQTQSAQPKGVQDQAKPPAVKVPKELEQLANKLKAVQELYPEKYEGRDLVADLVKSHKSELDYESAWKSKNPGAEFSWDDDEHADFIRKNGLGVPQSEIQDAHDHIIETRAAQAAEKRILERLERERAEKEKEAQVQEQVAPAVEKEVSDLHIETLRAARPDLAEIAAKDTKAALEKLKDDDIAIEAIAPVAQWADPAIRQAVRIVNGVERFDSKNNPAHAAFERLLLAIDEAVENSGESDQMVAKDGRKLVSISEYQGMDSEDRENAFTVTDKQMMPKVIRHFATKEVANRIKALQEKTQKLAEKMGYVRKDASKPETKASKPSQSAPVAPSVSSITTPPPSEGNKSNDKIGGAPAKFWESVGLR